MSLEIDDFKARIEASNDFNEIVQLLQDQQTDDIEYRGTKQATRKALELATTLGQVVDLWNATGPVSLVVDSNAILEKMIELIKTVNDLKRAYYVFACDEKELERRHLVRKIFDKADELGFPTI